MRTAIRLTGRRNIPAKSVEVQLIDTRPQTVRFAIRNRHNFNGFPGNSKLKLRLFENKRLETVALGDLSAEDGPIERPLRGRFSRPACQLRVVRSQDPEIGMVLGSTPSWTIDASDDGSEDRENIGILKFAVRKMDSTIWALEFPENDYPTIYLDDGIPNAKGWARNDPVFIGFVLPSVIREIFDRILQSDEYNEIKWMRDWLEWAGSVGAGPSPTDDASPDDRRLWIGEIVDGFSVKVEARRRLISALSRE